MLDLCARWSPVYDRQSSLEGLENAVVGNGMVWILRTGCTERSKHSVGGGHTEDGKLCHVTVWQWIPLSMLLLMAGKGFPSVEPHACQYIKWHKPKILSRNRINGHSNPFRAPLLANHFRKRLHSLKQIISISFLIISLQIWKPLGFGGKL